MVLLALPVETFHMQQLQLQLLRSFDAALVAASSCPFLVPRPPL
jgi:hypothetical protein